MFLEIKNLYILLPLFSAIFVVALGVFILLQNWKSKINILFLFICLTISVWMFGTSMMFNSKMDKVSVLFWDKIIYANIVFIPMLVYHLGVLLLKKKYNKLVIFFGYLCSFLFLLSIKTKYFIDDVYIYSWGAHTQARILHHVFLIFFFLFILPFFINVYKQTKSASNEIEKKQAKCIFSAFFILFLTSAGFLPAYGVNIYPFTYVLGVFFVTCLIYAILRHHLLDIKIVALEIFVVLVNVGLFIDVIISKTLLEIALKLSVFFLILFFSTLLIKSILKEIKTKEQLELTAKELKSANTELLQLDKAKSEFISIASHQLLTPLTPIRGYSSMLLEEDFGKINEKQEKAIKMIYESSVRLVNLVNDLLDISRIERGAIEYNFTPVDLAELIKSVIEELTPRAKDKKLYLQFVRSEENIPKINADEDKMREVLLNLIDNSIKYSSSGKITIDIKRDGNDVVFGVSDQGIGIKSTDMPLLFKKFSRSEDVKHIHVGGSGLGLYVARRHIEAHGGYIWAESPGKGKGSTFFVSLPAGKRRG